MRSRPTNALRDRLLSAFGLTDEAETSASTNNFLGVFGFTDHLKKQVQRLDAESANGSNQRRQVISNSALVSLSRPLHLNG